MSDTRWTKSPWNQKALFWLLRFARKNSGPWDELDLWPEDDSLHFPDEGDAHLIAAAPDLLEELEDRYHDTKCGCGHPACRRCQADERTMAVIAKAKGE